MSQESCTGAVFRFSIPTCSYFNMIQATVVERKLTISPNSQSASNNKMKKYIRSKNTACGSKEHVLLVQPTLPLDPPQVASDVKEEIDEKEYIQSSPEEQPSGIDAPNPSVPSTELKRKEPEIKPIMCRDFIRGKCTRIGCKYSHKCDVSQLVGVYTFCNDYQNSVCTRPTCKYVHANVFEEQHFYRTGELPAKAFEHQKSIKVNLLPPPPPPPEGQSSPEEQPSGIDAPNPSVPSIELKRKEPEIKPIMCRDFIRGKCTRIGCKYSHMCNVSQLEGVFTFCKDYQNDVCVRATCKYVHANVFEVEHFYRTGEIPRRAFAHLQKNEVDLPPPPPEDIPVKIPTEFNVPPPPIPAKKENQTHALGTSSTRDDCQDAGNLDHLLQEMQLNPESRKGCSNCEDLNSKIESLKQKSEELVKTIAERCRAIKIMSMKTERLKKLCTSLSPEYKVNLGDILSCLVRLPIDRQRRLSVELEPILIEILQCEDEEAARNIMNMSVADLFARLWAKPRESPVDDKME